MLRTHRLAAMHEHFGERQADGLRHAVALAVEPGKRPFADWQHFRAPTEARFGNRRECERPTPFRGDALEQRRIERGQRGRPEHFVPIERALDRVTHALDFLGGRSREQFEAKQRHRRGHVIERPVVSGRCGAVTIEPAQRIAQRCRRNFIEQLAVQSAANLVLQAEIAVAPRHIAQPATPAKLGEGKLDVVLRERTPVGAFETKERQQVVDHAPGAIRPQERHRLRDLVRARCSGTRRGSRCRGHEPGEQRWCRGITHSLSVRVMPGKNCRSLPCIRTFRCRRWPVVLPLLRRR